MKVYYHENLMQKIMIQTTQNSHERFMRKITIRKPQNSDWIQYEKLAFKQRRILLKI